MLISILGRKTRFLQPAFITCSRQYDPKPVSIFDNPGLKTIATPPLISVVIPSLNQGRFLENAITSVLGQNYPKLELMVVDGGSTDGSVSVIKKYEKKIKWWCSEKDTGQTNALNKGFSKATGDILAWLNADDLHFPYTLNRVAAHMISFPEVDVIYGNRLLIDEYGFDIGRWALPKHDDNVLTWADFIPQETLFWRRSIWEKAGNKLDESFQFAMDWDLLLRFRAAGAKMERLPFFLGLFRIHPNQKTMIEIQKTGFYEMNRLRKRCLGYRPSQLRCAIGVSGYLLQARLNEIRMFSRI